MALYDMLMMGGYGMFVWPAYGITLSVLLLNLWWVKREHQHIQQLIQQFHASET